MSLYNIQYAGKTRFMVKWYYLLVFLLKIVKNEMHRKLIYREKKMFNNIREPIKFSIFHYVKGFDWCCLENNIHFRFEEDRHNISVSVFPTLSYIYHESDKLLNLLYSRKMFKVTIIIINVCGRPRSRFDYYCALNQFYEHSSAGYYTQDYNIIYNIRYFPKGMRFPDHMAYHFPHIHRHNIMLYARIEQLLWTGTACKQIILYYYYNILFIVNRLSWIQLVYRCFDLPPRVVYWIKSIATVPWIFTKKFNFPSEIKLYYYTTYTARWLPIMLLCLIGIYYYYAII